MKNEVLRLGSEAERVVCECLSNLCRPRLLKSAQPNLNWSPRVRTLTVLECCEIKPDEAVQRTGSRGTAFIR